MMKRQLRGGMRKGLSIKMAEDCPWILTEDGSLNVETDSKSILYHPSLNIILVITNSSDVHVIDVNSGVILLRSSLSASSSGYLRGTYLSGQDKVLFTDGDAIGVRSDYNGVLLLDTILQTPISKPDDVVKLELLISEAVLLHNSLQTLELPGVDLSHEVIEELTKKIKEGQSQPKKGTKAIKWNSLCLELMYSSLKLVAASAVHELKRQNGLVPALPVASAITERLNCLLPGLRPSSGSVAGNGQDRSTIDRAFMFSEAARRETFGRWPHMNYKWALPDQMAQAGFYHQPSSTGDDRAMCFTCNVCLVCWEPTDEPWSEHERHSPSCPFVKGEYTQNVPLSVTLATSPAVPLRITSGPKKTPPPPNSPPVILGTSSIPGLIATATMYADPSTPPLVIIWNVSGQLKKEASFCVVPPYSLQNLLYGSASGTSQLSQINAEMDQPMASSDCEASAAHSSTAEKSRNTAGTSDGHHCFSDGASGVNVTALTIVGGFHRQNENASGPSDGQNTNRPALIVGITCRNGFLDPPGDTSSRTPQSFAPHLLVYNLPHLAGSQGIGGSSGGEASVSGYRREGARPDTERSGGSSGTRQENSITAPIFPKILVNEDIIADAVDGIPFKLDAMFSDYGVHPNYVPIEMLEELGGVGETDTSVEGTPDPKRSSTWEGGSSCAVANEPKHQRPCVVQCTPLPTEGPEGNRGGGHVWGLYPTWDGAHVLVVLVDGGEGCVLHLYALEWASEGVKLMEWPMVSHRLFGEGLSPVEVSVLPPEGDDLENSMCTGPTGLASLICTDGILRVIDMSTLRVCSMAIPEKGKVFVSATYCNSLERLCACTNKGSLHFFVLLGEEEGDSGGRAEGQEGSGVGAWEGAEEGGGGGGVESTPPSSPLRGASAPSPPPPLCASPSLIAHRSPLTLELLHQLHQLTQFENLVPCYAATVPPCWLEMMQAQKQRRHPQHLQRGDEVQHTRTWRLLQDGTTWDEHVFEITLPRSCCVGHVDVKYSLHPAILNPPNIEITLLKQNASGIGRKGKRCVPAVDDGIDFNIHLLNDNGFKGPTENPVTSEEYLKAHNTEILCGPVNIVSCLDLTVEGGTVTLTSPKLFQIRGRTLLVHIKSVPDKESVLGRGGGDEAASSSSAPRRSRGADGSKNKDAPPERHRYMTGVDRLSSVGKSVEGYRGCDWLHEISITIRKTKQTDIPRERAQRCAMLTSNSFLYELLDLICKDHVDPVDSLAIQPLALDILIWVVSIRLSRHTVGNYETQMEVIKAVQSCLEPLVRRCLLFSGRSIAHKFVKLIIICSEGVWSMKEAGADWGSSFDSKVLQALLSCLPDLGMCQSAGALRWLFLLIGRVVGSDGITLVGQKCLSLLLKVAQEINSRTNPYHLLLRTRCGLYGTPLEPEQFDAEPPTPAGFSSSPVTYATVVGGGPMDVGTANGTGGTGTTTGTQGGIDSTKSWTAPAESMDLGELLMEGAAAMGNGSNMRPKGIGGHVRGLLEVEPLHFTCHATSDGTRMERMEPPGAANGVSIENLLESNNFGSTGSGSNMDIDFGEEGGESGDEQEYEEGVGNSATAGGATGSLPPWRRLLALPPPQQVLVIERMHSGARRFAVLDFGGPTLLTDLIIPACSDLVSLSVDFWTLGEEVDGQRLVVASDIGTRSLVMNDLQPPPICRFLKITTIGRYGMSTTRCKIPVGSFYGHIVLLPGDSYMEKSDSTVLQECNIKAQLSILSALFEDIHCRYSLACARLQDLLDPLLASETPNVVHMHSYLQRKRDVEKGSPLSDDTQKITSAYQECVAFQHQLNLVRGVVRRLESALGKGSLASVLHTPTLPACTDKLRVLGECLLDTLLGLSHELGPNSRLPISFYKLFDQSVCETLFHCLCVTEDGRMQLATSHLLMKMCGMQPWWGDFLAQTLTKLYSSHQTSIFPMDRVFMLLMHLGRKSVALGDIGVLHHVLSSLGVLLSPLCAPFNGQSPGLFLRAETDLPLVTWLLLFLSFCLDSVSGSHAGNGDAIGSSSAACADDSSRVKDRDQGVPSRWDFIQGDVAMQRKMSSSGKSTYSKCYRRKLQKRLMQHKQQLEDLEATKKALNASQALANISSKLEAALKQQEKFYKKAFTQHAVKVSAHFKSFIHMHHCDSQPQQSSGGRMWWPQEGRGRGRGERVVDPDAMDRSQRILLPRSSCLAVTEGLVALILRADFTCNTDTFLLACKVLARIVLSTRPAISLGELMTREQLLRLIQLAVCNDQHGAFWGGPWASHAVSCLLQDILDAVKLYPSPVAQEMGPMEDVPEGLGPPTQEEGPSNMETSTSHSTPPPVQSTSTASGSTITGSGGALDIVGFGGEEEPAEGTSDAGKNGTPGVKERLIYGLIDTDDSELEEYMDDLLDRGRSHVRKGTNNVCTATSSISTAVDARLEYGVDGNAEITLRKMTHFGIYNLALISTPLQPSPEILRQGASDMWGAGAPSSSQWEDGDSSTPNGLEMVTYCFDKIFTDLHVPNSHTNLEMVLQLWLTLNQDNSDLPTRVGSLSAFDPSVCPSVSLSHVAISGLMSALTWHPNVTLRTWCLAFRCLTLAANLPMPSNSTTSPGMSSASNLAESLWGGVPMAGCSSASAPPPLEDTLVGMASFIVSDRNFVPMLIRFLSGAGESGHSNDGMAGPSVCHALHGLLLRLEMRTDVVGITSRLGACLKGLLLKVVCRLVSSPGGALPLRRGPLDAQHELLSVLLRLDFRGVELCTAASITESVGLLVRSYVLGAERVKCRSITSSLGSSSPSLPGLGSGRSEGGSRARLPPPPSWDTLICALLRLVTVLVQTPLAPQVPIRGSSSISRGLDVDARLEDSQQKNANSVAQTDEDKAERQQIGGDSLAGRDAWMGLQSRPATKVPCVADTVLQHEPTMVRLLCALGGCGGSLPVSAPNGSSTMTSCGRQTRQRSTNSSPPGERTCSGEPMSVGDCVFRLLSVLAHRATSPTLILGPLLRFLSPHPPPAHQFFYNMADLFPRPSTSETMREEEDDASSRNSSSSVEHLASVSRVVQLSEPLLWLILRVLDTEEALNQFNQMGGIGVICENLVKSNRALISPHPSLVSVVTRHLGRTLPAPSPLPRKPGAPSDGMEGLQNFAHIGTITSSSPTAQPADVLIHSAPLHRRARTPAWSYHFYPEEAWVELTLSLPCAVLLKVVELQPHLTSLATCPAAVAVEVSRDGGPPAPVCPPLATGGLAFIRLVLPRPEVASSVLLRLYRPRDASNVGLSQIRLLGSTAYGGEALNSSMPSTTSSSSSSALPPQPPPHVSSSGSISVSSLGNQAAVVASAVEEDARSILGWLLLINHCLSLPPEKSELSRAVASAAAAVPGLPQTCSGLLLVPPRGSPRASPPSTLLGPTLERVLLRLGLFDSSLALSLINLLLSNGAAAAFGNAGSSGVGSQCGIGWDVTAYGSRRDDAVDSVVELLFCLCTTRNDTTGERVGALLEWLKNSAREALGDVRPPQYRAFNGSWPAPPAHYVHCASAILWSSHAEGTSSQIEDSITPELFGLLHEWTLTLPVHAALKRALDWVLCSMCYIKPNLFPTLLKHFPASKNSSQNASNRLETRGPATSAYEGESTSHSATDDLKEREMEEGREGGAAIFGGERQGARHSSTILERRLYTLASACQSPPATSQLLASGLPSALARGILEFCKSRQEVMDYASGSHEKRKCSNNMSQMRGGAIARDWPLSQSTLTDADKAIGRESNNHVLPDGLGVFQVRTISVVLNFFGEVCYEGLMRDWLGSAEGSSFWLPLLNLLCNSPAPNASTEASQDRCELATEAYSALESATVKFFARCCWCHPANQQLLSTVLCEVIRQQKLVQPSVMFLHGISGFTRRLLLQLLLESEKLVVFVKGGEEMREGSEGVSNIKGPNYSLPGGAPPHPRYGVGRCQRHLFYLSTQTTVADILGLVAVAGNGSQAASSEGRGNTCAGSRGGCQGNGPTRGEILEMSLSMIAGLTAKDKRAKDARNDATAAASSSSAAGSMPLPMRGGTGAGRSSELSARSGPYLTHPALPYPLPRELTLAQLLVVLHQNGHSISEPRITLQLSKSQSSSDGSSWPLAGNGVESMTTDEEEEDSRKLLESSGLPSPLLVFTQQGGLALLAHHLPLVHPDALLQPSPPDSLVLGAAPSTSSQPQPPSPPDIDTEWVKLEANEDLYEEIDDPMLLVGGNSSPGMAPDLASSMIPPLQVTKVPLQVSQAPPAPSARGGSPSSRPSVPAHSLAAFRLFLRLPGYAEALLRERHRARCLLRLLLGVLDDGEGGDILSSPVAPSLPTLPFEVLSRLLDSTPLSTDDGVLLRRRAVESGAVHLLLTCLSVFTHHGPVSNHTQAPPSQPMSQLPTGSSQEGTFLPKMKNGTISGEQGRSSSDDKSHLYWAKGTGFGTGSTAQSWNVEQALLRQRSEEEHVTVLLKVLSSFINPGGGVPSDFYEEDDLSSSGEENDRSSGRDKTSSNPPLPPAFHDLLLRSCLLPAISSYLRNDSVLDMARHIPLYRAVLQLLRALALSPRLVSLLLPQDTGRTRKSSLPLGSMDGLALVCLLTKMKHCVDTYASRLRTNKTKGNGKLKSAIKYSEDSEQDEGLALLIPDIQETAHLVQVATDRLVMEEDEGICGGKDNAIANNLELPLRRSLEERYLEVMKKLQFDSYEMITECEEGFQFVVSYHFEPSMRAAGERCHPSRVKRLAQEAVTLSTSLPLSYSSSVFVRCDMDRLDIMKVLITGPAETPYANGCFEFDVYFPPDYPNTPMMINLETTGHHMVRFNPNLYNDGKVCLSVLNTWHGRPEEKWNANTSSFLQVLVSIQSLILVPEPYFNEPGYERSRGTPSGTQSSREYNSNICQATVKWAMLEQVRNPCPCFKEVIHTHFWMKRHEVIRQIEGWLADMESLSGDRRTGRAISLHTVALKRHFRLLKEELAKLKPPPGLEDLADSPLELSSPGSLSASTPADGSAPAEPSILSATLPSEPTKPQTPEEVDAEMEKMVSKVCE
ncbi:baculoviral IAP repeat-containing protein 6 [Ischnura elegans]|uniref:baculoviral IAP repeat-containing protein 6 n=1 Tax=Ischnura elegans TaxID=197161 RepID=UPI001ED89D81|nr:baculoviral IAP repeat-containing protein 6 [Ischnura elegans]